MAHEVFISYASVDKLIADAICATLESNKISCWLAPRDILPGKDFAEAIIDAIEGCRVLVLILSSKSSVSPHVLREINKAASKGISILSFIIEEVTLSKSMEYYLSTDHWLNATAPPLSKHIQDLAITVERLIRDMDRNKSENSEAAVGSRLHDIAAFATQVKQETGAIIVPERSKPPEIKPMVEEEQIVVDSFGSGNYRTISEALAAARPKQIIKVKAGTYRERIILGDKAVKLWGEGKDKVKISSDSDSVLEVSAAGSEIRGFAFTQIGPKKDNAVCLLKSSAILEDCRVSGGDKGIKIISGSPVVSDNVIERNRIGISVERIASPVLKENRCTNNAFAILYSEDAEGRASQNICKKNNTGIIVTDNARPVLEENECNENQDSGISYFKNGSGKALRNECRRNLNGITITDNSQAVLENNQCNENLESGLWFSGRLGGTARSNECSRNKSHGINICHKAQPHLENNQCIRNKMMGIAYFDSTGGTARNNNCTKNDLHGILVRAKAQPGLESNQCNDNREAGIAYFDEARGIAKGNICRGNRVTDIAVNGQATPIIG